MDGVVRPRAWSANAEGGDMVRRPASAVAFAGSGGAGPHQSGYRLLPVELSLAWAKTFSSVAQMFDPLKMPATPPASSPALCRDRRLACCRAVHSRTPAYAQRYLARFDTLRDMLRDQQVSGHDRLARDL